MKNHILSLLFLLFLNTAFAQLTVEKVKLIETFENQTVSYIPKVTSRSEEDKQIAEKINAFILDCFLIESFNQKEIEEFRWYEADFEHEIKNNILYITYSGEYVGAYPNYITEEVFFDLKTGEHLSNSDIPFQALFSLNGYLDFMNRFWLKQARDVFKQATECAESEPECSYYDIDSYSLTKDKKLMLSLTGDCYPRVILDCAPKLTLELPIDSVQKCLSEQGKKILVTDVYTSKRGVDKFLYNQSLANTISKNVFLFGKIDGKYPFSMALNLDQAPAKINGYYYYDRKLEKITLTGVKKDKNTLELQEFSKNVKTGSFQLNFSPTYAENALMVFYTTEKTAYLTGTWSNPDGSKTFPITFTEVKMNDKK